jgi:bifunctional UDP-N-acetylglucosamine pyrophosphorylase / glucosamine-1-phosphate N-acetyltransferase
MFTAKFDALCCITDQRALRATFGSDRLYLADAGEVLFKGEITLEPDVSFAGNCSIGDGARICMGSVLTDVRLGPGNCVRPYSILTGLDAGAHNLFGPFCFVRDGCTVADDCIIGAHVEAARSRFGTGVKISHRAFVGDAVVGANVIIGAGVVFCNWDGQGRQSTSVGADVVIGSGTLLVPPLMVGPNALIAAGSTVTKDVAANSRIIQKRV